MRKSEAYPSKYLSADDVKDGPTTVTVRSVTHELMTDGKPKPVIYVNGYSKGIVVGVRNADVLYLLAGTDDDVDWPGVTIGLFIEPSRKPDGTPCEAIRFRVPPQKTKAAKVTKAEFNEIDPPPVDEMEDLDEQERIPF